MSALVSAIVPVFDGGRFLDAAIASIRAQDGVALELIVVDDGSTDGTGALAQRLAPEARHIRQGNRGVAAARNRGIAAARGAFIAFLDQDDVWPVGRLERQLACFDESPEVGIVTGGVRVIGEPIPGRAWSQAPNAALASTLLLGAALIRRPVFDAIGMLDETPGVADDIEWLQRARDLGVGIAGLDIVTAHYRWHGGNTSRDIDRVWDSAASAIRLQLARRRRMTPRP